MPAATPYHSTSRPDADRVQRASHPLPPPRKTRAVRRRGGARNDFGSDEEFLREVGTDSESGDDDRSSVGSSTDSVSEDILSATHSRILTPNTTQSSADVSSITDSTSKPANGVDDRRAPFFGDTGNWSEMVAEETAHGPAELPVIEFADFVSPSMDQRPKLAPQRKPAKPSKRPPVKRAASAPTVDRPTAHSESTSEQPEDFLPEATSDQPIASTSRQSSRSDFRRPPGQSARQAYQQRLDNDPSYVPTVGEFWGHDDRLLDKDLRSLSGWWRGRWQSRGRGRGSYDRGFIRGRGRGASFAGPIPALHGTQSEDGLPPQEEPPAELPRVEQPWTHDGFEEMKKREEKRREVAQQQPTARPTRVFAPLRGRGGFMAVRGRGGAARGSGVAHHPPRSSAAAAASVPGKIWYAMKPEYPWTKHLETSLFHDGGPKPRPGSNPSYRVKLPHAQAQIVRGSAHAVERAKPRPSESQISEEGEKNFVVRLPKGEKVEQVNPISVATVEEPHLEDVFTVRPELVPARAPIVDIKLPSASVTTETLDVVSTTGPSTQPAESSAVLSGPPSVPVPVQPNQPPPGTVDGVLHGHQDTVAPTLLKADTPHAPESQDAPGGRRTLPPVPPPLQTVFSPPQSSPPYSSPYGYGSPLPPGIAISQHGMAYEVATGRAVYLPAPIYTPRPLAHGMMTPPGVSFMPGHIHHHPTGSPDFLSAPHTPPVNGFIDPATGSPIFAFPRQSSRVEIRAPSQLEPKSTKSQRRPSSLRTSAATFEPCGPSSPANDAPSSAPREEQYPSHNTSETHGDASAASEQNVDPAVYNYTGYQQAYYYPDQYGYSQYYDMSQMPRYEMYQTDPHASQAVYY